MKFLRPLSGQLNCFAAVLLFLGRIAPAEARLSLNFNRDWKFQLGDHPGAGAASYDDSSWDRIGLPHSFSIPYFGFSQFYTGYGWYRKQFQAPANWNGQRIFLEFDGVFQDAEVFVNGVAVGRHRGGYTGFSLDITDAVKSGEDNVIAIRVNNLWNARIAPRAGEHTFSGGIYRDVHLVITNPLHVAWYGTFVTTPTISKDSATVNVKTELANDSSTAKSATIKTVLLDHSGKAVAQMSSSISVPAKSTGTCEQTSMPIANPKLWSPESPNLYTARITILEGTRTVDEFLSPFGFRWMKFTADQGFFLNGEHVYILGANVHQDHAGWGDAVTNAGFERDVKMVKETGFNFIRGSHYPHDPAFAEACDQLGVMLWSENAFWGTGGFKTAGGWSCSAYPPAADDQAEFEASVKQQLQEMIRIYRNHPSIVAWSMCNEVFFTEKSTLAKVREFLKQLVSFTHELDPTRPAAIGGAQRPLDQNRIDQLGDVAGYNGDGASIGIFQNPGVPSVVSEYGSITAMRPGNYAPGWDHLAKDDGKSVHPWRSGQAIWCMFDHGSIAGTNLGRMGIVDYFRIPKRAWYWYRNEYRHIAPPEWPTAGTAAKLKLEADRQVLTAVDGTQDAYLTVKILDAGGKQLSNSPNVKLEILSGPGEFPTGRSITFEPKSDIAILDGQAAIEFRSYYGGKSVIHASSPGLISADITIESKGEPQWVEGVTPAVKERPYQRFTQKSQSACLPKGTVNLAADRPTKASSTAGNSSSANLTDGNLETAWVPASEDSKPWIQVDLENTYTLTGVQLSFPSAGDYSYQIAVSSDGNNWERVVNQALGVRTDANRAYSGNFGHSIRFIRVTLEGWPQGKIPSIAEIAVEGGTEQQ